MRMKTVGHQSRMMLSLELGGGGTGELTSGSCTSATVNFSRGESGIGRVSHCGRRNWEKFSGPGCNKTILTIGIRTIRGG